MERPSERRAAVEAELRAPLATTWVVHFELTEPSNDIFHQEDVYWLDLCVTPRPPNARACYPERWLPDRFERIGDLFLVPPGQVLHARGDRGRQTSIICQLHAEAVRSFLEQDLEWSERRLEASLDIRGADLRNPVLRLGREACHPGFASGTLAEQVAGQLAIELFRYEAAITEDQVRGGLAPWRLRIIDERLADLRAAPTLAELAALCDLSPRQLTRSFRASRGCSIGEYVAHSQVERAKRLLTTGESIKAIASSLGFHSAASFSTAFRRATGQAPREFRQSARTSRIPVGRTPYGRY